MTADQIDCQMLPYGTRVRFNTKRKKNVTGTVVAACMSGTGKHTVFVDGTGVFSTLMLPSFTVIEYPPPCNAKEELDGWIDERSGAKAAIAAEVSS
jgi:hypothetical protein